MRFWIWQSKGTVKITILLLIFKSSTPYIGKDLRHVWKCVIASRVIEKLQIKDVGPLSDMDKCRWLNIWNSFVAIGIIRSFSLSLKFFIYFYMWSEEDKIYYQKKTTQFNLLFLYFFHLHILEERFVLKKNSEKKTTL